MQQIGQLILYLTFATTMLVALTAIVGAMFRNTDMLRGARYGVYAVCLLNLSMAAVMMHSLVTHDFSNKYIATYTDLEMPTAYVMAAFWGGEKGALLFWTTVLSTFSAVAIHQNRRKAPVYMGYTGGILMLAVLFFLVLMVFESSPFEQFLTFAGPEDGQGMNPLLQNPTMTIHPPSLLTGYISFTLPFAFGLAALITGKLDDEWIKDTRKWTIVCWIFLTTGLILGGAWAYEELGWGGYWMWDPVENAGLIPWFTATAFLHSVMIQERRQMLKRWNFFLVLLTFLLTIFGTFLTRSQLIDSIHAFADSALSGYFLWYMVVIAIVSAFALAYRWKEMRSDARIDHFLSRESFFVLNNILLLGSAFVVMWGTLFSKVSETQAVQGAYNGVVGAYNATLGRLLAPMEPINQAVVLGEPWFNRVMIPIGIMLLLLTAIGPVISWRKATRKNFQNNLKRPLVFSAVATALGALAWGLHRVVEMRGSLLVDARAQWVDHVGAWTNKLSVLGASAGPMPEMPAVSWGDAYGRWADGLGLADFYVVVAFLFSVLVLYTVIEEFYRGAKLQKAKAGGAFVLNVMLLTLKTPRRYGGYIIHLGIVLAFVAFAGGVFKTELPEQPLYTGERIDIDGYHLTLARQDDLWEPDGAYVASRATMVVLQDGATVPRDKVDAVTGRLEQAGLTPFFVETYKGSPAIRLRFADKASRARVREAVFVETFFKGAFVLVDASPGSPVATYSLREMEAVQVLPPLMHKIAERVRTHFEQQPGKVRAAFMPGASTFTITFGDVAARDAFLARVEGEPLLPDLLGGWYDAEQDAVNVVPAGVGTTLLPEVRFYQKHGTPTTEVAIQSKPYEDLYLAMRPAMGQPFINILAVVFPLVSLLWAGALTMVIGALICLLPKSVSNLARGAGRAATSSAALVLLLAGALVVVAPGAALAEDHGDEVPLTSLPDDGITTQEDAVAQLFAALRCADKREGGLVLRDEPLAECHTAYADELRARLQDDMARFRGLAPREAMHRVLEAFLTRDASNERLIRFSTTDFNALYGGTVCTCGCTRMALSNCPLSCGNSKSWKTRFKVLLAEGYDREQAREIYLESSNASLGPDQTPFTMASIIADPRKSLTWALPAVVISGAAVTFVFVLLGMRRRRRTVERAGTAPVASSRLSDRDRQLLDDELSDMD